MYTKIIKHLKTLDNPKEVYYTLRRYKKEYALLISLVVAAVITMQTYALKPLTGGGH